MGLIYQREKDIETFVSQPFWDCLAEFQFGEYKLEGKWFNETAEHIFDQDAAQALAEYCKSSNEAQVYSVFKEEKRIRPPQFYNLSGLQMEANRLYGMAPLSVLNFAQALYDKSYITYPRSDSTHLTPEEAKWLPTILDNLSKIEEYQPLIKGATRDISNDKRYVDASKVSDHYGIVLTEELVNPLHLPKGEQQIYDLIAKSIIAAHYPDFLYDSSEIVVTVQHRFSFKSKGKQLKDEGWKAVFSKEKADDSEDDNDAMLPPLTEGEMGTIASIELKEGATTALPRFSQGDLIKIMANAGHYCKNKEDFKNSELKLGTEATRANIISTITARYVKIHKNLVYLQPEGRILIEALGQDNYLTSVITTGRMERYLENIKNGKGTVEEFTKGIETVTKRVVEKLKADAPTWDFSEYIQEIQESEVIGKCKICGADVLEHTNFFGCSAYKEKNCEFKIPKKILGKAISKENVVKLLETGTTSLIKGFKPKDKDSTFDAFLVWSENKKSINFRYK